MSPRPTSIADSRKANVDQVEILHTLETPSQEQSLWQNLKQNPRIIAYSLLANSGSLLFGFDILVQGAITALPAFSNSFGSPFKGAQILPALWLGLWQAFNAIGIMIGAASNGYLQDRFGRRVMFFVGGIVAAISTAIIYIAADLSTLGTRRGVLLLGKTILGMSMGIMMSTCQTYVSEVSPPKLRTFLLGLYAFMITVGQMIAISLVFSRIMIFAPAAFKVPFAAQWAFSGYALLAGILLPESPVYLAAKDRMQDVEKSLKKLHGSSADITQHQQIILLTLEQERIDAQNAGAVSYADCFKGSDLRRTRIVAVLHTLQQFIGVSLVANSTYFLIMSGMSPTQSLTVNQIGVGISMVGTVVSWLIMAKVGRRLAILGSFVAAGAIFLGMGIAGCWSPDPTALRFIGVALLMAAICSNLGVGTAYPIVTAEIPSARLRAKTLGFGFGVNAFMTWIFSFTVPYMFNADQGNLGGKIGFVFAGLCLIGFVVSWFEIPETKDISYAQIDYLFQNGTKTRDFKKSAWETHEMEVVEIPEKN